MDNEIIDLTERAWEANRNGDAAFYDNYLTDDVISVSPWGVMTDRPAILKIFEANNNPYTRTDQSDHHVIRLTDDTVIHTSTVEIDSAGPPPRTTRMLATTVMVRRDGQWKASLFQVTPVA